MRTAGSGVSSLTKRRADPAQRRVRRETPDPEVSCEACPRLVAFREANRAAHPEWHNAPVPAFGDRDATLLVVGLAPGLKGANRTGIPFTGDASGDWLWSALHRHGFASSPSAREPGGTLTGAAITNAVKCVPPGNHPTGAESATCRAHLIREQAAFAGVRVVVALGRVAHEAWLRALGLKLRDYPFAHGAAHRLPGGRVLLDTFHPSPLNTNTGRLTRAAWNRVWKRAATLARQQWFVYVARCEDGTLYTGITTDVERRRAEHTSGRGAKYTRSRGLIEILHVEEAPSKGAALSREYAIKQLPRAKKLSLVAG